MHNVYVLIFCIYQQDLIMDQIVYFQGFFGHGNHQIF
jgi:hypothetical protein